MPMTEVFFSRCKPYTYDAIDVALESNRIFFGYALRKNSSVYNRHHLKSCIVDVTCDQNEWDKELDWAKESHDRSVTAQFNKNRNFVRKISRGSIALIPRPSSGVIYCGVVDSDFELVDDPSWYDTWERIWSKCDATPPDEVWAAGEVSQTWHVDKFRAIPVPRIPVWIRRSLFGRSTYGIVKQYGNHDPVQAMSEILDSDSFSTRGWTLDLGEIQKRLVTDVTPSSFEHLVVSLLQLENSNQIWTHVGGSGDGGIDGIGAGPTGEVVGLLQCKWAYSGEKIDFGPDDKNPFPGCQHILASAFHPDDQKVSSDLRFISKYDVAEMLAKHWRKLPQSIALRIGEAR